LLRITHTIISQSSADYSWITLYILLAKQVVSYVIVNFHKICVQVSNAWIFAKPASLQATCLQKSYFASKERCLFSRSIWCASLRPLEVLLPSAIGWTTGVSSLLQSARALRYQCGPAHWHCTISKTIACLTSQEPNIAPNMWEGGDCTQQHTKIEKHFLKYVVTPLKYRLPTWCLHTKKDYDSTSLRTPYSTVRSV
jgi:hypothetical protein